MMKSIGWVCLTLVLAACNGANEADKSTSHSNPAASGVAASNPVAMASAPVVELPASCQQMMANIEKCVVKYEKENPAEGLALRAELEQLRGQISTGTDAQALDQACSESNRQSAQIPETQC